MIRPASGHWGFSMPSVVVFDLEYTAWECSMARSWLTPGQFREVVQIGAVKLDADSFLVQDEFEVLTLPRFNPVLSPYFEKLRLCIFTRGLGTTICSGLSTTEKMLKLASIDERIQQTLESTTIDIWLKHFPWLRRKLLKHMANYKSLLCYLI